MKWPRAAASPLALAAQRLLGSGPLRPSRANQDTQAIAFTGENWEDWGGDDEGLILVLKLLLGCFPSPASPPAGWLQNVTFGDGFLAVHTPLPRCGSARVYWVNWDTWREARALPGWLRVGGSGPRSSAGDTGLWG